jgi:tryptophan halogenase
MNITILGGGSAGWITALLTHAYYPNHKITVVESDSIGILGAGEGTTPQFIDLLNKIKITVPDMVKNCGATIKQGINFENWNGDGVKYFHSFTNRGTLDEWHGFLVTNQLANNLISDDLNFSTKISDEKKVGFSFTNKKSDDKNPMLSFDNHCHFALHFDARLLAQYFKKVAQERGIIRIEGELNAVASDEEGNIKQLQLKNGVNVDCDFIFDCSGFARILIGKFFQTEWVSYEKFLPMNTALPFFIEHNNDVKPQTDAIAMKYGWMWRIPVNGRYGCGYVFDSNYVSEEQALQEAEQYFGQKLTSPKTFKFKAGTFKETLVKNCMAVGLAQSFVEPLEATSIWLSYVNLDDFLRTDGIFMNSEGFKKHFNQRCFKRNDEMKNFLYLHYLTKRNDSHFWQQFREKQPMINEVRDLIEMLNENEYAYFEHFIFENSSWMQVAAGLNLFDTNKFKQRMDRYGPEANKILNDHKVQFLNNMKSFSEMCLSHKDFLEYLRQN